MRERSLAFRDMRRLVAVLQTMKIFSRRRHHQRIERRHPIKAQE